MKDRFTLAELADKAGIPARTIRFYIARGLLDGPVKSGRGATYTAGHLKRLDLVSKLQAAGRTLSEIGRTLAGPPLAPGPAPTAWWQHAIADDVLVWVQAGASPWRMKQISEAIADFANRVRSDEKATTRKEEIE